MKLLEEDHINHCVEATKGQRHAKRHVFQNCHDDVFQVHIWNKHHPFKISWEDMSPFFLYIEFVRINSLDDQITHAKACLPHHYEQQILKEEKMNQSCQTCTTW